MSLSPERFSQFSVDRFTGSSQCTGPGASADIQPTEGKGFGKGIQLLHRLALKVGSKFVDELLLYAPKSCASQWRDLADEAC